MEQRNKKDIIIVIVALVSLVVLSAVVFFLIHHQQKNETAVSSSSDTPVIKENKSNSGLFISEVSSADWIELYNNNDEADLEDYVITVNGEEISGLKGTVGKNAYFVLEIGNNISLCEKTIRLESKNGKTQQFVYVPALNNNESFASVENGSELFAYMTSTKGTDNSLASEIEKTVPYMKLSGGFYFDSVIAKIYIPTGTKVYYTTDGTIPTESSEVYDDETGIVIDNYSKNPNYYSAQTNLSAYYSTVPSKKVDKGCLIKAIAIDGNGKKSPIVESVYFVGINEKEIYNTIPTISISADPIELFGYFDGIYVKGAGYDEAIARETNYGWSSNYCTDKTIDAHAEMFDESEEKLWEQNVSFGIYLDSSTNNIQKSLRFTEEDGTEWILSSGDEDSYQKLRNVILSRLGDKIGVVTQSVQPVNVFLEGEYWGTYILSKQINAKSIADEIGVEESGISYAIFEEYPETAVNNSEWNELAFWIISSDMSLAENYKVVEEAIDVDGFIKTYCYNIYIANSNFPETSWVAYKDNNASDKRWKFITNNLNSTVELSAVNSYTINTYLHPEINDNLMLYSLMRNDSFAKLFKDSMYTIAEEMNEETVTEIYEQTVDVYYKAIYESYERFIGVTSTERVLYIKDTIMGFVLNRWNYLKEYTDDFVGMERPMLELNEEQISSEALAETSEVIDIVE